LPQIAPPHGATLIFTSPSCDSHIPAGSAAKAELIATIIRPSAEIGSEKRVISNLQRHVHEASRLVGYRSPNREG
jgi:hypothetical protein